MVSGVPKVNEDRLGVTDMKETVRFGRESSYDFAAGCCEVCFDERWFDLRISPWFVKLSEEPFFEDRPFGC